MLNFIVKKSATILKICSHVCGAAYCICRVIIQSYLCRRFAYAISAANILLVETVAEIMKCIFGEFRPRSDPDIAHMGY